MALRQCLLKMSSLHHHNLLLLCISLYLYRHPPLPEPHQTCQTESSRLPHQINTLNTLPVPHHSRKMIYRVRGTRRLPNTTLGDLRPLTVKQVNQVISRTPDQKAQQGFPQARKKRHWRKFGVSYSMKMAIRQKDLVNSFVVWQCIL